MLKQECKEEFQDEEENEDRSEVTSEDDNKLENIISGKIRQNKNAESLKKFEVTGTLKNKKVSI